VGETELHKSKVEVVEAFITVTPNVQ